MSARRAKCCGAAPLASCSGPVFCQEPGKRCVLGSTDCDAARAHRSPARYRLGWAPLLRRYRAHAACDSLCTARPLAPVLGLIGPIRSENGTNGILAPLRCQLARQMTWLQTLTQGPSAASVSQRTCCTNTCGAPPTGNVHSWARSGRFPGQMCSWHLWTCHVETRLTEGWGRATGCA